MRVHSKSARVHSKCIPKVRSKALLLCIWATKNVVRMPFRLRDIHRPGCPSCARHAACSPLRLMSLMAPPVRHTRRSASSSVVVCLGGAAGCATGCARLLAARFSRLRASFFSFFASFFACLSRRCSSASRNHPRSLVESTCEAKRRHVSSELDQEAIASAIKSCGRPQ